MRLALVAALLALAAAPVEARGDDFAWPGQGTIRLAVPPGWELRSAPAGEVGMAFRGTPRAA